MAAYGVREFLAREFGDSCDAFPRKLQVRSAPVARLFHHNGDGEHDGGRWYAVFESRQRLFRTRALPIGTENHRKRSARTQKETARIQEDAGRFSIER